MIGTAGGGTACVVVLNWNSSESTLACLDALAFVPEEHVLVVDNASRPSQVAQLEEGLRARASRLLRSPDNLGYAAGMNRGMREARTEGYSHALLLNPDTLPTKDVVDAMLAQIPSGAAVVGTAQTAGLSPDAPQGRYTAAATKHRAKMRAVDCDGCPAGVHDVDVVSGAALLVDLRVAEQVGYMDESYFHYKEEVDFCVRVRLTGERVRFCCAYALRHERGGSLSHRSPMAHYYATRNELLFVRRFYGWLELLRMPRLVASLLLAFVPVRGGAHARSVRLGVWHALRGVTGHLATPVWMS